MSRSTWILFGRLGATSGAQILPGSVTFSAYSRLGGMYGGNKFLVSEYLSLWGVGGVVATFSFLFLFIVPFHFEATKCLGSSALCFHVVWGGIFPAVGVSYCTRILKLGALFWDLSLNIFHDIHQRCRSQLDFHSCTSTWYWNYHGYASARDVTDTITLLACR